MRQVITNINEIVATQGSVEQFTEADSELVWSDINTVRLRFVIANVLDKTTRIVAFQHLTSLSF
jgi:hypothetical protein